ncbi:MAG: NAD(P)H-hydrate epimerase [Haloferacaceae archaeon]
MQPNAYRSPDGTSVPAVTRAEMERVDRVATEDVGLDLVRMMEHAGRGLATTVLGLEPESVTVLAGSGGNGGGALACARHLANRRVPTRVHLTRDPEHLEGATAEQLGVLEAMEVPVASSGPIELEGTVVDGVIGYGLEGSPRGGAARLIAAAERHEGPIVALDVPSGVDSTTGDRPGAFVSPDLTATLALPKTGLIGAGGQFRLLDLSIPDVVYERVGLDVEPPFGDEFVVGLSPVDLDAT